MKTQDFDFTFPEHLIALEPLPRGESRMMVVERNPQSGAQEFSFTQTKHLADFLAPGDALVLNDTRVLRARLIGKNAAGGKAEVLLLAPRYANGAVTMASAHPSHPSSVPASEHPTKLVWEAMVKPAKRFRLGDEVEFSPRLRARVVAVQDDGSRLLDFGLESDAFHRELEVTGKIPLPPYIRRDAEDADAVTYQSVWAEKPGSVAAPTASLHISDAMLDEIKSRGVEIRKVTLHVGAGTFKPVQSENIEAHAMHSESFEMSAATAAGLNAVRARGGKIWAVGTTAARVLETQARGEGGKLFQAGQGETRIFIYPGYQWKAVDGILTNFHWPKSTLFMLVCSLLGIDRARRAYAEAFAHELRLFSYGDAMLIR